MSRRPGFLLAFATVATFAAAAPLSRSIRWTSSETPDGFPGQALYVLKNGDLTVQVVISYGAIVTEIARPRPHRQVGGRLVLGFDATSRATSAAISTSAAPSGQFANRIAGGKFSLGGEDYTLAVGNEAEQPPRRHQGLRCKVVTGRPRNCPAPTPAASVHLPEPRRRGGLPRQRPRRRRDLTRVTKASELRIGYKATTDEATPVSTTNHGYFQPQTAPPPGDGPRPRLDARRR